MSGSTEQEAKDDQAFLEAKSPSTKADDHGVQVSSDSEKQSRVQSDPEVAPKPTIPPVSLPPIRSMSIKSLPHHNSLAKLRLKLPDGQEPDQIPDSQRQAKITSMTIHDLESLLSRTLDTAKPRVEAQDGHLKAGVMPLQEQTPQCRPSEAIKARASVCLEHPFVQEIPITQRSVYGGSTQASGIDSEPTRPRKRRLLFGSRSIRVGVPKSTLAEPGVTRANGGLDHKQTAARCHSLLSLQETAEVFDLVATSPPLPGVHKQPSRSTIRTTKPSMRKQVKRHIAEHGTPPVLPRTTSKSRYVPNRHAINEGNEMREISLVDHHPGGAGHEGHYSQVFGIHSKQGSIDFAHINGTIPQTIVLDGHRHVDVHNPGEHFDVHDSCYHQPIARDWPTSRKHFAAVVTCINTACIGIIIGIYAGEVPAIQYVLVDFHHYSILGNVFLYAGLALPTLFLWPLPLLHGRKSYTVVALSLALCLQIPQGIALGAFRSPFVRTFRVLLLLSRAVSGFVLGFASINLQASLLDLFGASLQSGNLHQEQENEYDVRHHGGGVGVWLGIWCWCTIGSISVGFLIGGLIITSLNVTWGFWTSLLLLMFVLQLNVIAPELRRSAYRRTVAEIRGEKGPFNRVARGEIKMHLKANGPYWWGEEVKAGVEMMWLMVKQPGFLVLAIYAGWVYAQFTVILMLIAALASRYYKLEPAYVGLCAVSLAIGAAFAIPFQKASLFSRARHHIQPTNNITFQGNFACSSHLLRRIIFTIALPVAALGYSLTSGGPPIPLAFPCVFAAIVGFLSNLALAECYGLIMETFDTSDLQPGMTGRPARKPITGKIKAQRTNFSCYPRVSAGMAFAQGLMFLFGAIATGVCGRVERQLGARRASAVVAGVLFGLTTLLTIVLWRGRTVKMLPESKAPIHNLTRSGQQSTWEPVILGDLSGRGRKISILEAGRQSRWSEIRRRNRIDSGLSTS